MRINHTSLLWVLMLLTLATGVVVATESSAQISFTGKVLDGRGQPVPDAKVTLYQVSYGDSDTLPTAERVNEVVTGPDGAYSFAVDKGSEGYRQGSVIVQKKGFALSWAVWEMREGDGRSDISIGEPQELSGVVVDEGDSPVIDAEVSIAVAILGREQDRRYLTYFVAPRLLTVKTDSEGRFAFPNLPAEVTCEFLAKKTGRATICSLDATNYRGGKCQFAPGQPGIKLTLPAEARIEGKVVDGAGQPVSGVRIFAEPDQRGLPFTVDPIVSAEDGTFFIGNLVAGGYTIRLPRQREAAEWVAQSVKLSLKAGETARDVRLTLSKGGVVEVFVKDERNGKPIEKANLGVREEKSNEYHGGTTDANGVARIRLAPGSYRVDGIYKDDYVRLNQGHTFAIAEGETKRIEEVLSGLPTITGVVYDDSGKPLEGATVKILPGGGSKDAVSDARGEFQVRWDTQGWSSDRTVFYIVARHIDRNLGVAQAVDTEGAKMELKLRPAATLAGQVVDPNGKGIEGANLLVMLRASNWGSSFLKHGSVRTDPEGKFEAPVLPAEQRYDVVASADGYGQMRMDITEDRTTAGRIEVGRFSLPLANLSVSGTIVDSEGKPVPGARVSCYGGSQDNQPNRDTETDSEGRFTLDQVCAGRINISANSRNGVEYGSIQTEGGARNVQIAISDRSSSRRYVPRTPASLKGKRLPDLKKLGIELPADANDRMILICFWDMNQRPSRHCMSELLRQAPQLAEKGVMLVGVHGAKLDQGALEQWIEQNKPSFPVSGLADKIEETKFEWGVVSLPHLILTDKDHIVIAEGFALLGELDKRIEEASGQSDR